MITHAELSPFASANITSNASATPSPAQIVKASAPSAVVSIPPLTPFLVTAMEFDKLKHPCKSDALLPTSAPTKPSSKLRCQIKQTPGPAPSKSNGGAAGNAKIFPASSVITHAEFVPIFPVKATSIGSPTPSPAQIVVGSAVEIVPPSVIPSNLVTVIGLDKSKHPDRSLAFIPTSAPVISPLKLKCHTKQTPTPAPSKSNGGAAGNPNISPVASVITHAELSPFASASVTSNASATPSPAQIVKASAPSAVVNIPPSTPFLVTAIEFDKLKHPSKSDALFPTAAPSKPSSKLRCQIKQTPGPAPSKSNGGAGGNAKIFPASSVITHAEFVPMFPVRATSIGSPTPSPAQIVVGSVVEIVPPSVIPTALVTVIGLDKLKQPPKSLAFRPTSAPVRSSSWLRCQIKQTPSPAPSKSNGGAAGKPKISPSRSVITQAEFVP